MLLTSQNITDWKLYGFHFLIHLCLGMQNIADSIANERMLSFSWKLECALCGDRRHICSKHN